MRRHLTTHNDLIGLVNLTMPLPRRFKANTFESINALVTSGKKSVRIVVVYRPPSKKDQSATAFLAEFALLLESLALDSASLFIVGDFNIHMNDPTSRTGTANMLDLLAENDLTQLVHGPTHRGVTLWILSSLGHQNAQHRMCGAATRASKTTMPSSACCTSANRLLSGSRSLC